jgi:hypothetical protein
VQIVSSPPEGTCGMVIFALNETRAGAAAPPLPAAGPLTPVPAAPFIMLLGGIGMGIAPPIAMDIAPPVGAGAAMPAPPGTTAAGGPGVGAPTIGGAMALGVSPEPSHPRESSSTLAALVTRTSARNLSAHDMDHAPDLYALLESRGQPRESTPWR